MSTQMPFWKKFLIGLPVGIVGCLMWVGISQTTSCFFGAQGGTGICSTPTSTIGQVLTVSSSQPFAFKLTTPSAGGSSGATGGTSTAGYFSFYQSATSTTGTPFVFFQNGALNITTSTSIDNLTATVSFNVSATGQPINIDGFGDIYIGDKNGDGNSEYLLFNGATGNFDFKGRNPAINLYDIVNDQTTTLYNTGGTFSLINNNNTLLQDDGNNVTLHGGSGAGYLDITVGANNTLAFAFDALGSFIDFQNGTATRSLTIDTTGTIMTIGNISASGTLQIFGTSTLATTTITSSTITTLHLTNALETVSGGTGLSSYVLGDTLYASATNTLSKLAGNTSTMTLYLSQTGNGTNSTAPSWQPIPAQSVLSYYFYDTAATTTYKLMQEDATSTKVDLTTASVTDGQVLANWITPTGTPNFAVIPAGAYEFKINAKQTVGVQLTQLVGQFWEVNSLGQDVAMIGAAATSSFLTGSETTYTLFFNNTSPYSFASTNSRLLLRVKAVVTLIGTAPTAVLSYGGTADSHIEIPGITVDASTFVPYTGATKNLDMGTNNVSTTGLTFNNAKGTTSTITYINTSAVTTTGLLYTTGNGTTSTITYINFTTATGTLLKIGTILATTGTYGTGNFTNVTTTGLVLNLTGYLKGAGISGQVTAVTQVPNTDVSGLGTMSTQNANAVSITGGSINGTTIGQSTATFGTFSSITTTNAYFNGGQWVWSTQTSSLYLSPGALSPEPQLFQFISVSNTVRSKIVLATFGNGSDGAMLELFKGHNNTVAPTSTAQDDILGGLAFDGYASTTNGVGSFNAANDVEGASIEAHASSTWTATSTPTYISFYTTAQGTSTRAEVLRITGDGKISTTTINTSTITFLNFQNATGTSLNISGTSTFVDVKLSHLVGNSSAPTIATSTGAGTGVTSTASIAGTDLAGLISLTTGASPSINATVVTVTFSRAYQSACYPSLTPTVASSVGAHVFATTTASTYVLKSDATGLTASTTYQFSYHCIQ